MSTFELLIDSIRSQHMVVIPDTASWCDEWIRKYEQEERINRTWKRLFRFCTRHRKQTLTYWNIIHTTARHFGMTYSDINVRSRKRPLVLARQISMYFGKKYTRLSLNELGQPFGLDHTTVLYTYKTINNLIETDKKFKEEINQIKSKL